MGQFTKLLGVAVFATALAACATGSEVTDADTGGSSRDTGGGPLRDTGAESDTGGRDTGRPDTTVDTGPTDTGPTDTGPTDTGDPDAPPMCTAPLQLCGDQCVDINSNPAHCGVCLNSCPTGQVCENRTCTSSCAAGTTNCSGACVNPMTSLEHCGGCGLACRSGETCENGMCQTSCGAGEVTCGGVCTDIQNDALNCGGCNAGCNEGQTCSGASCVCEGGLTSCVGGCFDTMTDPDNCGGCGVPCGEGQTCMGGSCACPGGDLACGDACVDTTLDPNNCGGCGITCGSLEVCVMGDCVDDCPGSEQVCGGACVNTDESTVHCGSCDNGCRTDQVCDGGICDCGGDTTECGGVCRNTDTDVDACGDCGISCRDDQTCTGGDCVCEGGLSECSGACVDLQDDDANCGECGEVCGDGRSCASGSCVCSSGTDCDGACIDTDADPANCGGCGVTCDAAEVCVDGGCTDECPAGLGECDGRCVDTSSDADNCGMCGLACDEGTSCRAGMCGCVGDHLEPNDDRDTGTRIANGDMLTPTVREGALAELNLCEADDRDVFVFVVPGADGVVDAELLGDCEDGTMGARIAIVDGSETELAASETGGTGSCPRVTATVGSGAHGIIVESPAGDEGTYRLRSRLTEIGEIEANDSRASADGPIHRTSTFDGTVDEGGFFGGGADLSDFYRIDLFFHTALILETTGQGSACGGDTVMYFYDEGGSLIDSDDDGGSDLCSLIGYIAAPGTYYVEISPYSGAPAYRLNVLTPLEHELEPNDLPIVADAFGSGTFSVEGAIQVDDDLDYYVLTLDAAGRVDLQTRGVRLDCEADTVIELYDETGETLLFSDDESGAANARGAGNCAHLTADAIGTLDAGTYLIAVGGFSGRRGPYLLNATVE